MNCRLLSGFLLLVLTISSCKEKSPSIANFAGFTQGTTYSVVYDNSKNINPGDLRAEVERILGDFDWIEFIIPETAKPLAFYDDPFFKTFPAITENRFGKGSFIYEGCLVSDEIQSKIISAKALETGLIDKENQLAYPIVVRSGINDQGKTIRYYLNYSGKEESVNYTFINGTNLFTNATVKKGDTIILKPWDVAIVEE
jgi:beta-galactosidase GanA